MNKKLKALLLKLILITIYISMLIGCKKNYLNEFIENNDQFELKYAYTEEKPDTYEFTINDNLIFLSNKSYINKNHIKSIYYLKDNLRGVKRDFSIPIEEFRKYKRDMRKSKKKIILIELNDEGKKIFSELTSLKGENIAFLLNSKIVAGMTIHEQITDGKFSISSLTIENFIGDN